MTSTARRVGWSDIRQLVPPSCGEEASIFSYSMRGISIVGYQQLVPMCLEMVQSRMSE